MKRASWQRLFLAAISLVVLELGCSQTEAPKIEQAAKKLSGSGRPPVAVEVTGSIGYIIRLADGRLFTVYGQCRPENKWDDVSIPQPVFGRFSTDRGASWSEPSLLFNTPGPGWMHMLLPLGTRDGAIHLFGLMIHRIKPPVKWTEATADIWHAVSHDAGKTGKPRATSTTATSTPERSTRPSSFNREGSWSRFPISTRTVQRAFSFAMQSIRMMAGKRGKAPREKYRLPAEGTLWSPALWNRWSLSCLTDGFG